MNRQDRHNNYLEHLKHELRVTEDSLEHCEKKLSKSKMTEEQGYYYKGKKTEIEHKINSLKRLIKTFKEVVME